MQNERFLGGFTLRLPAVVRMYSVQCTMYSDWTESGWLDFPFSVRASHG